ncbi:MAG: MIP/aquaporin family protein [Thermoplasmata archaeon]
MATTPVQRYLAEFLGTFGLLLSVTGAALLSIPSAGSVDPLTRVILISVAIGTGLTGMIYAFGDLSGAHFNPAVTVGCWVAGRFRGRDVVPYVIAQLLGALLAVAVIAEVAAGSSSLWHTVTSGGSLAAQGYSGNGSPYSFGWGPVFLLEAVFTFFLVTEILFATRSDNSSKNLAPLGIGLTLLMINLVAIPVDGASVNPARSFAPALLSAFWSPDHWAIQQDWIFWVAPIVGALIAALVDRVLRPRSP